MRRPPATKRRSDEATKRRRGQQLHLMNGVARSFDAGLSLAALGRLGGAVERSLPRGPLARSRDRKAPLPRRDGARARPGGMKGEGSERWWRRRAREEEAGRENLGRWFLSPPPPFGFARSTARMESV